MNDKLRRFTLAVFLVMAACTDSTLILAVPDNGGPPAATELVTQVREIPDVGAVTLSGAGFLYISQGARTELTVRSEQRVLDVLGTEVTNRELHVGFTQTFTLDHLLTLDCFLTVTDLSEIHIQGLWRVNATGLSGSPLSVRIDGLGEVNLAALDLPSLTVDNRGPGNVNAWGRASSLSVALGGMGSYAGGSLVSEEADVSIGGSGSATVTVRDRITARISGSGHIYYYGDPVVTRSGDGSGSIRRVGG